MKKITKDNKGITLIALVITIIIMSVLVTVVTYSGIDTYKNAKVTNFVAQMKLIQSKVDDLVQNKTKEEINNLGLNEVTTSEQINAINTAYNNQEILSNVISEYKVFTTNQLLDIFEIEDIESDIMVNFTTREVVSVNGIDNEGKNFYTQYKLPNGQALIQDTNPTNRNLEFSLEAVTDGLNATITISNIKIANGTLSYKEQNDSYWQTITNYTETGEIYSVSVSKTGTYEFVLKDNVSGKNSNESIENEGTIEIVPEANKKRILLCNSPKTNQEITDFDYSSNSNSWARVEYNGIDYVWIPRFSYNPNDKEDIRFLKGTSNIATDNTYIDDTWPINEKFTNNGTELTGVWINIDVIIELEDMDRVLNDASYDVKTEILKEEEL